MFARSALLGFYSLLLLITVLPDRSYALGPTLPSDMYSCTVESSDPDNSGYYYVDISAFSESNGPTKNYTLIFDADGNIVWYRKSPTFGLSYANFQPFDNVHLRTFSEGDLFLAPCDMLVMDTTSTIIFEIPRNHPTAPGLKYDMHEILLMDDGTLWTLWKRYVQMDMSQYWPDGQPNATVAIQFIQLWDWDGNILWEWNSLDHMDELDITARIDTTGLANNFVEHLHGNSLDVFPDGDLLLSSKYLSVCFRIDRETGDVLWKLGGGPLNEFAISSALHPEIPVDFNEQHDCRVRPDGNITVFDNGYHHPTPRSYAKEYVIDENAMTAELVVAFSADNPFDSHMTGSHRELDNGHRVVGWGGLGNEIIASEVDENLSTVWELSVEPVPGYQQPFAYRCLKSHSYGTAATPYISDVVVGHNLQLVCNWWGHEDEVAAYDVYFGTTPTPAYFGTTETGKLVIEGIQPDGQYYARVKAVDAEGLVISEYSNLLFTDIALGISQEIREGSAIPSSMTLSPAWPNPFNGQTNLSLLLPSPGNVDVAVYDLLGRLVTTLHDGSLSAGQHQFNLNATGLSSGMYFVRAVDENGATFTRRVTLVK